MIMTACVSEGTSIALYADDTKIWRNIQTWQDHLTLQNDINQLYEWSVANKMMFHPKKCKVLTVTVEQTLHCDSEWKLFPFQAFYYQLNDRELEQLANTCTDVDTLRKDTQLDRVQL